MQMYISNREHPVMAVSETTLSVPYSVDPIQSPALVYFSTVVGRTNETAEPPEKKAGQLL